MHCASGVTDMSFLPQWGPLSFLFPRVDLWLLILCDIQYQGWWHSLNTAQGHSSSGAGTDTGSYEHLSICPGITWISFFLHVHKYQVFPPFFSSPHWEHVASIVFLARFSHFNPSSCERKEEEKKDGSVSEEAHGSWGSLITVTTERETEDERHERWSAADMAGISPQRWDESTYSAALALLLISGCDITSSSRPSTEGLWVGEAAASWSKGKGSECITLWPTNAYGFCIELLPVQQLPEAPEYLTETTELWITKMYRLQWESQLIRPNADM